MTWDEVADGTWIIPHTCCKTGTDVVLPLSKSAQAVLAALPRIGRYPFSGDGRRPIGGFSRFKREFDKKCGVKDWRLHDLRRTSRSLLSRAGIAPDIAEKCLGHAVGRIRSVYDKHDFAKEKPAAFEALAAQIDRIVDPQENVTPLRARKP
jgi:integrase